MKHINLFCKWILLPFNSLFLFLLFFLFSNDQLVAQAKFLDKNFANIGYRIDKGGDGNFHSNDVFFMRDGKIITFIYDAQQMKFTIFKFHDSGIHDSNFYNNGSYELPYPNCTNIMKDSFDNFYLYSASQVQEIVYKLDSNFNLINAFGDNGKIIIDKPLLGNSYVQVTTNSIFVYSENKYSKYDLNGDIDLNFGNDIKNIKINFSINNSQIIFDSQDRIYCLNHGNSVVWISRFLSNGILDTSFGMQSKLIIDSSSQFFIVDFDLMDDNSMLIIKKQAGQFHAIKYFQNGRIDTNFADSGVLFIDALSHEEISCFKLDSAFLLLKNEFNRNYIIFKYNHLGILEDSFSLKSDVLRVNLKVTNDDIYLFSDINNDRGNYFQLEKRKENGNADLSFGNLGLTEWKHGNGSSVGRKLFILPDNEIIQISENSGHYISTRKIDKNGFNISTYGNKGELELRRINFGYYTDFLLQDNGDVTATGYGNYISSTDKLVTYFKRLANFTNVGLLDSNYQNQLYYNTNINLYDTIHDGKILKIMPMENKQIATVVEQSLDLRKSNVLLLDSIGRTFKKFEEFEINNKKLFHGLYKDSKGRLYATGLIPISQANKNYIFQPFIVSYNSNGDLNHNFGDRGFVILNDVSSQEAIFDISFDSYDNLLVTKTKSSKAFIVKINKEGTISKSFGDFGYYYPTDTSINFQIQKVIIDDKDRVYFLSLMDQKTIIQRLESNGSLDQQYGINAKIEVQLDEGINSIHDIKWDNLQHLLITGSTSNYNSYILRLANDIETAVINADEIKNPILIYPNPTHKQFKVNFYSECNTDYVINLLNESGQKIKTLYQANFPVGEQTIDLQVGDELVSGNYFIELMSLNKKRVLKLIVCE